MTDKQIIIDEIEINPNDWLEPYKPIPACEIKDCDHLVYAGDDVYGCRIAEDGLVCDDFNNDDECCMYRQLEYYKEALKTKEQECKELKKYIKHLHNLCGNETDKQYKLKQTLTEIKEIAEKIDDSDGCAYGDYDCDNCSSLEQETVCTYKVKKLILQKISECEGNDE